jgi:hypothetical protein
LSENKNLLLLVLQARLGEHEHELLEMNTNSDKLQQTYNELLEFKLVLSKVVSHSCDLIEITDPCVFYVCSMKDKYFF